MANIILKGMPQKFQELYYSQCELPTKVKPLVEKLEALEPIVKDFTRKKDATQDAKPQTTQAGGRQGKAKRANPSQAVAGTS